MDPTHSTALIVDGHNLLFASYFGMPDRIKSTDGTPIHGVYGFIAVTLKMIKRFVPAKVVICFDSESRNFRNDLSASYKSNRVPVSPGANPFSQLKGIKEGLDFLGIAWTEVDGVEADDVIGSFARHFSVSHDVLILSMDHDMYQLIDQNVRVVSRARGQETVYGWNDIERRYGIKPPQYPHYIALVGDRSDFIEGVEGIGPKTAASLLTKFGDIDGIFQNLDVIHTRIASGLRRERSRVVQNVKLAMIRTDLTCSQYHSRCDYRSSSNEQKSVGDVMRGIGLFS